MSVPLTHATHADSTVKFFYVHITKKPTAKGLVFSVSQTPKIWELRDFANIFLLKKQSHCNSLGVTVMSVTPQ